MIAIALTYNSRPKRISQSAQEARRQRSTTILPFRLMLGHYFPSGMLGIGLTALMATFMSGMAGNVTAFNTVWTYDIYQAYIKPTCQRPALLWMGRMATVFGIALSVAAAYVAHAVQQHHGHAAAGIRVRQRAAVRDIPARNVLEANDRPRSFLRLAFGHDCCGHPPRLVASCWCAVRHQRRLDRTSLSYPSEMAQNFWTAICAWTTCFIVTIVVSLMTKPRDEKELVGLVYSLTEKPHDDATNVVSTAGHAGRGRARDGRGAEHHLLVRGGCMGLDIRLPIGLLFSIFGILLLAYGLVRPAETQKSLGLNVNLEWGAAMLVFGAVMLFLGGEVTLRLDDAHRTSSTKNDRALRNSGRVQRTLWKPITSLPGARQGQSDW